MSIRSLVASSDRMLAVIDADIEATAERACKALSEQNPRINEILVRNGRSDLVMQNKSAR